MRWVFRDGTKRGWRTWFIKGGDGRHDGWRIEQVASVGDPDAWEIYADHKLIGKDHKLERAKRALEKLLAQQTEGSMKTWDRYIAEREHTDEVVGALVRGAVAVAKTPVGRKVVKAAAGYVAKKAISKAISKKKDSDESAIKTWNRYLAEQSSSYVRGSWPQEKAKLVRMGMPKEVQQVADKAYLSAVDGTKDAQKDALRMYGSGGANEDPSMLRAALVRQREVFDYTGDVSVVYYGPNNGMGSPENTWTVRNALEDSRTGMYFYVDEGRWYYDGYYGKKPMPGGQREAMSNAELMFHG